VWKWNGRTQQPNIILKQGHFQDRKQAYFQPSEGCAALARRTGRQAAAVRPLSKKIRKLKHGLTFLFFII
jgi:hypothetical protein